MQIDTGPMNSLRALIRHLAPRLKRFSEEFRERPGAPVKWDLRSLRSRRVNTAALTAFVALAHRLRDYSPKAELILPSDPYVCAFLWDIGVFTQGVEYDLFDAPRDLRGGSIGKTNPNTKIDTLDIFTPPPPWADERALLAWKTGTAGEFAVTVLRKCRTIFNPPKAKTRTPESLAELVSKAAGEYATNSWLHGESRPFIGLQRSPSWITVAICDAGNGFLQSFGDRDRRRLQQTPPLPPFEIKSHLDALLAGAFFNKTETGLYQTIDAIIKRGGKVHISSYSGFVSFDAESWPVAEDAEEMSQNMSLRAGDLPDEVPGWASRQPFEQWTSGVRGSRITFEIPVTEEAR